MTQLRTIGEAVDMLKKASSIMSRADAPVDADVSRRLALSIEDASGVIVKALAKTKKVVRYADAFVLNSSGKVLMLMKKYGDDTTPKLWGLPGGHVEAGEDPKDAAIRELKEETGIEASEAVHLLTRGAPGAELNYYYCGIFDALPMIEEDEHQNFAFVSIDDLDNYECMYDVREIVRELAFSATPEDAVIAMLDIAFDAGKVSDVDLKKAKSQYGKGKRIVQVPIRTKNGVHYETRVVGDADIKKRRTLRINADNTLTHPLTKNKVAPVDFIKDNLSSVEYAVAKNLESGKHVIYNPHKDRWFDVRTGPVAKPERYKLTEVRMTHDAASEAVAGNIEAELWNRRDNFRASNIDRAALEAEKKAAEIYAVDYDFDADLESVVFYGYIDKTKEKRVVARMTVLDDGTLAETAHDDFVEKRSSFYDDETGVEDDKLEKGVRLWS